MAHWRLFYHFVWATKNREPLLTSELQTRVVRYLTSKGGDLGAVVLAADGSENHMHVVAAVPPRIAPAEFVKRLKGASSRLVNREFGSPFAWQEGYAVYSLSQQDVAAVVEYVRSQKEHHARGRLMAQWEVVGAKESEAEAAD